MRRAVITCVLVIVGATLSLQPASAKVFVGHTNLTIHVAGSSVSGKLVGNPQCRPNQTIELWVDGALQSTTTTDGSGDYSLTGSFSTGSTVQTRFAGSQTGTHPNVSICTPALSRVVVIKGHGHEAAASSGAAASSAGTRGSAAHVSLAAMGKMQSRLSLGISF